MLIFDVNGGPQNPTYV